MGRRESQSSEAATEKSLLLLNGRLDSIPMVSWTVFYVTQNHFLKVILTRCLMHPRERFPFGSEKRTLQMTHLQQTYEAGDWTCCKPQWQHWMTLRPHLPDSHSFSFGLERGLCTDRPPQFWPMRGVANWCQKAELVGALTTRWTALNMGSLLLLLFSRWRV